MSGRPIPPSLRRRGIQRVTDNIPPGHSVRLPAGAFFTWFGDPLRDYIRAQAAPKPQKPADATTQGDEHGD